MRVLITGAASLVGSRLCEILVEEGHDVVGVDDLSTGTWANVAHLERGGRFELVERDVGEMLELGGRTFDAVAHLALPSSARATMRDPAGAALACVAGTKRVLELARGARIVMAPSLDARGAAACVESLAIELGVDVRIVRMPSAFGPQMEPDDRHPVAALVLGALGGRTLAESSEDARTVVRVTWFDDAARALHRALALDVCPLRLVAPHHAVAAIDLAHMIAEASATPCRASLARMPPLAQPRDEGCAPAADALDLGAPSDVRACLAETMSAFEARTGVGEPKAGRTSGIYRKRDSLLPAAAQLLARALGRGGIDDEVQDVRAQAHRRELLARSARHRAEGGVDLEARLGGAMHVGVAIAAEREERQRRGVVDETCGARVGRVRVALEHRHHARDREVVDACEIEHALRAERGVDVVVEIDEQRAELRDERCVRIQPERPLPCVACRVVFADPGARAEDGVEHRRRRRLVAPRAEPLEARADLERRLHRVPTRAAHADAVRRRLPHRALEVRERRRRRPRGAVDDRVADPTRALHLDPQRRQLRFQRRELGFARSGTSDDQADSRQLLHRGRSLQAARHGMRA